MNLRLCILSGAMTLATNLLSAQYISTSAFPNPTGISEQGKIVGYDAQAGPYYTWNPDNNEVKNIGGIAPGNNHGSVATFSYDEKYISGTNYNNQSPAMGEMSRYNAETQQWQTLGGNGSYAGSTLDNSSGYYISGDGKTLVGLAYNSNRQAIGFAWNEEKGALPLPSANPLRNARANAVSADGSVIVGWRDTNGPWKSAVWRKDGSGNYTANEMILINPAGNPNDYYNQLAEARAVSGDGKWIGGKSDLAFPNAWIWSQETGLKDLGTLTTETGTTSWVTSFNYDGSVVLGYSITKADPFSPATYRPWIWTEATGMKNLNDYIQNTLSINMNGETIYVPTMISSNGKYMTGWAFSQDGNTIKVFRIDLSSSLATNETKSSEVKVYPNPVNNVLNINSKDKINDIKVYNTIGQLVYVPTNNSEKTSLDTSNLKSGVYLVNVATTKEAVTHKIIKK